MDVNMSNAMVIRALIRNATSQISGRVTILVLFLAVKSRSRQ